MPRPVAHITAPWPTQEEMETSLGISRERKMALQPLVDEVKAQLSRLREESVTSLAPEKSQTRASAA